MHLRTLLTFATVAFATAAFAQDDLNNYVPLIIPTSGFFQVRYASNLNQGDSYVNITNTGNTEGNICANVYTFDQSEEMVSCCACLVTPDGLVSLSVQGDLISNTLSPSTPINVVIKLLATVPGLGATPSTCNASSNSEDIAFAFGMRAWGTTLHALPATPATYGMTEGSFLDGGTINFEEIEHLTSFCGFIQSNGSGFGICKSCRTGGLAGAKQ